jgi:hypothetical protein
MTNRIATIVICTLGVVLGLLLWMCAWEEKARQRAEAYCQDHQMVLVDTPAGERCAPLWALENIRSTKP